MTMEPAGERRGDAEVIILRSLEEIRVHKWIESEKRGRDMGGNAAALDWLEKYYDRWLRERALCC